MISTLLTKLLSVQYSIVWASPVAQTVKNLPIMQETQVWFLGQEDLLEKGMATHSSILAWRIPWKEEPGGLLSMRSQRVGHDLVTELNWTDVYTHPHKYILRELQFYGVSSLPFLLVSKLKKCPGNSTALIMKLFLGSWHECQAKGTTVKEPVPSHLSGLGESLGCLCHRHSSFTRQGQPSRSGTFHGTNAKWLRKRRPFSSAGAWTCAVSGMRSYFS